MFDKESMSRKTRLIRMPSDEEVALVNKVARRNIPYTPKDIYTFQIKLCNNEVDRDGERFMQSTLATLGQLFIGKIGIYDHKWDRRIDIPRIYRTELVSDETKVTKAGDTYCYLKGYAYISRTKQTQKLIAAIEDEDLKEVSVGCSIGRAACSICGTDIHDHACKHVKWQVYDGKLCCIELYDAMDAYEWAFVTKQTSI